MLLGQIKKKMNVLDRWGLPVGMSERDRMAVLYEDPFREVKEERRRILQRVPAPCPRDFPKELRRFWKGHLEFSLTPCQTGWLYLRELKEFKQLKQPR